MTVGFGKIVGVANGEALLCSGRDACLCEDRGTNIEACGLREVGGSSDLAPSPV